MKIKNITKEEVLDGDEDINTQLNGYCGEEQERDLERYPDDGDYFLDEDYKRWCEDVGESTRIEE